MSTRERRMTVKKFQRLHRLILAVIILEMISPVPLLLSFGSLYILVRRPAWFLRFIHRLYNP